MSIADDLRSVAARIATERKPSRKHALKCVEDLIAGLEHNESLDGYSHVIAELYAHFLPNPPKKPKTAFDWVARAVDPKDAREELHYAYADGEVMVASDGKRLHLMRDDSAPGFYAPNTGDPVNVDRKFPDYRRVIPESGRLTGKADPSDWQQWPMREIKKNTIAVQVSEQTWVNRDYLQDALYGFLDPVVYTQDDPSGAVVVAGRHEPINALTRLAVIMPMRV